MAVATKTRKMTFAEFCAAVRDGEKADLIDGVIYKMASPGNTDAGKQFLWLARLMGDYVEAKELGQIYGSRIAFRLAEHEAPEPDIAFVVHERVHLERFGFFEGPPDLAVEIVSPESRQRDYVRKKKQYQQAGVREYWIVDEAEHKFVLYRLSASGRFREVKPRQGVILSQVLTGFSLRPEWLWQSPRPRVTDILKQILAGKE